MLWLWRRPAVAAQILPLAWERPCATTMALIRKKKLLKLVGRTDHARSLLEECLTAGPEVVSTRLFIPGHGTLPEKLPVGGGGGEGQQLQLK